MFLEEEFITQVLPVVVEEVEGLGEAIAMVNLMVEGRPWVAMVLNLVIEMIMVEFKAFQLWFSYPRINNNQESSQNATHDRRRLSFNYSFLRGRGRTLGLVARSSCSYQREPSPLIEVAEVAVRAVNSDAGI